MSEHPIGNVMDTLFQNMKNMVDANTIIGNPITTPDGTTIIPVSKITFGFGSGGGDKEKKTTTQPEGNLFNASGGGGVSIIPVAFLVSNNGNIRLLPITNNVTSVDRIIDSVPDVIDKINAIVKDYKEKKESAQAEE